MIFSIVVLPEFEGIGSNLVLASTSDEDRTVMTVTSTSLSSSPTSCHVIRPIMSKIPGSFLNDCLPSNDGPISDSRDTSFTSRASCVMQMMFRPMSKLILLTRSMIFSYVASHIANESLGLVALKWNLISSCKRSTVSMTIVLNGMSSLLLILTKSSANSW